MRRSRGWQLFLACVCAFAVWVVWYAAGQGPRAYTDITCREVSLQMSLGDTTSPQSGSQTRCFLVSVPSSTKKFKVTLKVQDPSGQYDLYIAAGSPVETALEEQHRYNFNPIQKTTLSPDQDVEPIQNRYTVAVAPVGDTGRNSQYVLKVADSSPRAPRDSCSGAECTIVMPGPGGMRLLASDQFERTFLASCPGTTLTVSARWSDKQNVRLALYAPNRSLVASQDVGQRVDSSWSSTLRYTIRPQDLQTGTRWWAVLTNTSGDSIGISNITVRNPGFFPSLPFRRSSCPTATLIPTRPPPTPTPSTPIATIRPSEPSPPNARISNFRSCDGPCRADRSNVTKSFPANTTEIYLAWDYENIPVGARYNRIWRHLEKGAWVRYECSWSAPSSGSEEVKLWDTGGLHSGTWEVTIMVNGRQIAKENVEIRGNVSYWAPAGTFNRCK